MPSESAFAGWVLGSLSSGIVAIDEDGVVVMLNEGARRVLGCGADAIGRDCRSALCAQPAVTRLLLETLDEALAIYAEADSAYPGKFTRQKASLHELRFEFDEATGEFLRFLQESPTALSYVEGRLMRIGENEDGLGPVIARVEAWIDHHVRRRPEAPAESDSRPLSEQIVFRKLLGDLHLEAGDHEQAGPQGR